MIQCSQKVRSVCPYRKACGGGVYKEGSACDKFAESLQNKKAHKPGSIAITREQVEKMRGEWRSIPGLSEYYCSRCGEEFEIHAYDKDNYRFCPYCMAPMTEEAVDILWKRLEEMQDATD